MSTNPLETISQFAALIELMKDPKSISVLVDEAKKIYTENKKYVEARSKLEQVEAHIKTQEAAIESKYQSLDGDIIAQNLRVDKFMTYSKEKEADLAEREAKMAARELAVATGEKNSAEVEKVATKLLKDAQDLMAANDVKTQQLVKYEQDLQAKAAKIAAIVS